MQNRNFVLVVLFGALLASPSRAEEITGFVEPWVAVRDGAVEPTLDLLIEKEINGKWGAFGFAQGAGEFFMAYGGPSYSPSKNLKFALGPGIEDNPDHHNTLRVGGFVSFSDPEKSLLYIQERGEGIDNSYHRFIGQVVITPNFSLGPMEQSGFGWGIRGELDLWGGRAWVAPLEEGVLAGWQKPF